MNPLNSMMPAGMGQNQEGPNLLSILIDAAVGFVLGLMLFIGPKETISFGSSLAADLLKLTGYGQQMAAFGFATTAAPYIVLAPALGMVVRELSAVRSLKSFGFFAAALVAGIIIAFFSKGYFLTLISTQ